MAKILYHLFKINGNASKILRLCDHLHYSASLASVFTKLAVHVSQVMPKGGISFPPNSKWGIKKS